MSKEQILQELADAFERVIAAAQEAPRRDQTGEGGIWGPREVIAHMAGWEVIATSRIPHIVAGMPPFEYADEAQQTVMDDAINAMIVAMIGDQSLDAVCGMLRRAYQSDIEMLENLDASLFQPGEYVYERAKGVIEHCQEHMQELVASQS